MSTPTLILGNNKWAIEEDSILGYAVEDRNGSYLPREIPFTRGSDATFTTSTGVIRQACWNLLGYSEEFDNAYWTKSNSSITTNAATAPNGALTADALIENTSNSTHRIFNNTAISVSTTIPSTYSVYLKSAGRTRAWVRDNDIVGALFNLSNGTIVSTEGTATATITDIGDGWYRCTITRVSSTTSGRIVVYLDNGTSDTYTGNGTSGVYIWGAQLVQGSDALGYLRTTDRLNMPRVDSSTGTKTFLLEPQRTNLLLNSVFDGTGSTPTSWSRPGGTGSSLLTASTLGSGAQACSQSATAQRPFLQQDYTVAINTTYTFSMYIESISGTINYNNVMYLTNLPAGATTAYYLNNNLVDEGSQAQVGRLSIRVTIGAASSLVAVRCGIGTISNSTATILFSRPQFEVGSYQTTYIPTQATTVTRIVDSFVRSNIYTNGYIGRTSGTWFVELRNNLAYTRDASGTFYLDEQSGGLGNGFNIRNVGTPNQRFVIVKYVSFVSSNLYFTLTDTVKLAIKWNGATADVFVNGVKVVSGTSFTSTAMEFLGANGSDQPKYIEQMELYSAALDDAECISITTL